MSPDELKSKLLAETDYFVETEWLDMYVNLVLTSSEGSHVVKKTHSHHIIPVSYFTSRKLPVDHSAENRVELSFKNHMLAHLYLSGCTKGRDKYKNLYALFQLSHFDKEGYLDIQNYDKYEQLYDEAISAAPSHRKGTKCSKETRARMSAAQRKIYAEKGQGVTKDTVWMNNGSKDVMVKPEHVDLYTVRGYVAGRLYRHSKETIDKISEAGTHKIITDEFRKKMSEIATRSNANRGEEWRRKISETKKAYFRDHENNWKGKHHSDSTKQKLRNAKLNRVRIDKGDEYKIVKRDEVDRYIKEGWSMHTNKEYVKTTDWVFITDGITNKKIHKHEFPKYEKQGFILGKLTRGCNNLASKKLEN